MAKTLKKKKPWMSVDEAISLLARSYEDGFTAADLHDLILEKALPIHGFFTGYIIEMKPVGDGVVRPFGNTVVKTETLQDYVLIPADHPRLRSTLCDLEIDMPELRMSLYKPPSSPHDNYFIFHQGASLPPIEIIDGRNQLTETATMATFTRAQLFLKTSELYAHLAEGVETDTEATRDDELSNRSQGPAYAVIKALSLTVTADDVSPLAPARTIADAALRRINRVGYNPPAISAATLANYIAKSSYVAR